MGRYRYRCRRINRKIAAIMRKMLQSKIHRATVTHADVHYEGSITLPPHLLDAAGLVPYQAVSVWNVTNGHRFETYAIRGLPGGDIAINGAAAHLAGPGDIVIVSAFAYLPEEQANRHQPRLVFVDAKNRISDLRPEVPGPSLATASNGAKGQTSAAAQGAK
jgi:aspartate 1-decarboxylase